MTLTLRPVKELTDAIRKNGWAHGHGELFQMREGVFYACALGQAALNLEIVTEAEVLACLSIEPHWSPQDVYRKLEDMFGNRLANEVWKINDTRRHLDQSRLTLDEIADAIEQWAKDREVSML